jgi:hypothetical protein
MSDVCYYCNNGKAIGTKDWLPICQGCSNKSKIVEEERIPAGIR